MVRHILIWKVRADVPDPERILNEAKREIEALQGRIEGLKSVRVFLYPLASSSADAMIECTFEDLDGLSAYKAHPAHIAVANKYIRPFVETKLSFD
ncbi:MAG: Dabb family protein, partial [Clostridia bacterium]|nr:Dabb family protein [Clostridia bacterium]